MDMIHIRAVSPPDLTDEAVGLLADDPCVLNLIVRRDAARHPDGDSIACDVLTGAANDVLHRLRTLRVDQRGSLVIEPVDMAFPSETAEGGGGHSDRCEGRRSGSRSRHASGRRAGTGRASTSISSSRE